MFCIIIAKTFASIGMACDGERIKTEQLRRKLSEMATTENKKELNIMWAHVYVRMHAIVEDHI